MTARFAKKVKGTCIATGTCLKREPGLDSRSDATALAMG